LLVEQVSRGEAAASVRCAQWARAECVDPIGTAGSYDGWLLVETPLPWPREFPVAERNWRFQAVVPDGQGRRSFGYERPAGKWFTAFTGPERAVLVCSHGKRDVCCGSLGTVLARGVSIDGVRVWRTSHLGGHRFAPTAVVLPEGTAWAFLDADRLRRIVERDGPPPVDCYRGCSGLTSPAGQAVERLALAEAGWAVLDHPRRAVDLGDGRTRLEVQGLGEWEATVCAGRRLPVPDCSSPGKVETELRVLP
jgi:hypothetical protein